MYKLPWQPYCPHVLMEPVIVLQVELGMPEISIALFQDITKVTLPLLLLLFLVIENMSG